jgi:hypothetical protein
MIPSCHALKADVSEKRSSIAQFEGILVMFVESEARIVSDVIV